MNATNSPLDQWQIDHIRKMKQELGMPQSAPDAEEVTMDETDTETAMPTGGLDYAQAQQDFDLASQKVRDQIQSHIDVLEGARGKLRDRRVGPSDSEKWLAIAAALGQPTRTGAFGESLGNLAQTLGAQKSARREAEEKRDLMLEKYGLDVGTERLRLLQTGATQAGQTLRAAMAANKPVRGIAVGDKLINPYTNEEIQPPKGTKRIFEGRTYEFIGGNQYNKNNWKVVK